MYVSRAKFVPKLLEEHSWISTAARHVWKKMRKGTTPNMAALRKKQSRFKYNYTRVKAGLTRGNWGFGSSSRRGLEEIGMEESPQGEEEGQK